MAFSTFDMQSFREMNPATDSADSDDVATRRPSESTDASQPCRRQPLLLALPCHGQIPQHSGDFRPHGSDRCRGSESPPPAPRSLTTRRRESSESPRSSSDVRLEAWLDRTVVTPFRAKPGSLPFTTTECAICMEAFAEGDKVRTLSCLHCYHADCVDQWLASSQTCPMCKYEL